MTFKEMVSVARHRFS